MARLGDIVIDCAHAASLARFWTEALDDYQVAPYDEVELARLASLGIVNVDDDPTVLVIAPMGPRLWFQTVAEPKAVKNRVHLDLRTDDPPRELARLITLGATVLDDSRTPRLTVLADPEGNEFCVLADDPPFRNESRSAESPEP